MNFSGIFLDNIITFLKANIEPLLVQCETAYSGSIMRTKHFDSVLSNDLAMPFILIYESETTHSIETQARDLKTYKYILWIKDSRADKEQFKRNVRGYRDSIEYLIEFNPDMADGSGNLIVDNITMPPYLYDNGNYSGVVEMHFHFETV
jgi:hypothetical protein